MVSWQFLLIGSFGAVGAALAVGTIAALASYRRTGRFPNQSPDEPAPDVPASAIRWMYVRIVVGLGLGAWAIISLFTADLI